MLVVVRVAIVNSFKIGYVVTAFDTSAKLCEKKKKLST